MPDLRHSWKSLGLPEDRSQLRNTIMIDPIRLPPKANSVSTTSRYYGTRLSTVVLISRTGQATFIERDMWHLGDLGQPVPPNAHAQRQFRFSIQLGVTPANSGLC
jgi:uncharacterized protein with NRDE domain